MFFLDKRIVLLSKNSAHPRAGKDFPASSMPPT